MIRHPLHEVVWAYYQPESPAHDFFHLVRVCGLAVRLARMEGGTLDVVLPASYLHDLHRHEERRSGQRVPAAACDELVIELLRRAGVATGLHGRILAAIHYTEVYSFSPGGRPAADLDCRIVRDADNLDAIGAIGVARTFAYGGHLKEPLWDGTPPPPPGPYRAGAPCPSVIHHFYQKLLRLRDDMDTASGRLLAERRHQYMKGFIDRFMGEWGESILWSAEEEGK